MTIKLIYHASGGDIALDDAGIMQDDGWFTTVFIMLFSDRRADNADELPDSSSTDKRGWPGDSYFSYSIGSRLWLLSREKIVPRVLYEAKDYASEALEPLLSEKMAKKIDVQTSIWEPASNRGSIDKWLRIDVAITKADNDILPFGFSMRWENN